MDYFGLVLLMLWTMGIEAQYNPNHAHRQCSRLSPMPCCPHGFPIPGRIRCPMARCPMGFSCHTHVLNRWGVCCRNTLTINQRPRNTGATSNGVARPMSRTMSTTCTSQSNLPCCQFGQPMAGIDCQVQRCSNGYTCFTHTAGQWAVCCPMSQQQTSRTVVVVPGPMGINPSGPLVISGPGFSPGPTPAGPSIPQETQIIGMTSCSSNSPTPCCPSGTPIPGTNCRFGSCPAGSSCNVHEADAWAVCCPDTSQPRPSCSRMSNVACCQVGSPLPGIQCRVQACPPGYTCNSHVGNRWAVCCQDSNTAVSTQTCSVNDANACCPRGEMIPGTQCRTRPCLNNQYCSSNPQGRWAVCCQEFTNSQTGIQQPVQIGIPSCTASSPTPCCSRGEPLNRAQCRTRGCPPGYTCNGSTVTGWTACCPTDGPPTPVPMMVTNTCSRQSPRPCCRRGNPLQPCQLQNCPSGFECHTHITNAWSVCCAETVDMVPQIAVRPPSPAQSSCRRQNVQPCCAIGRPVPGIDCRAQSCPFGYACSTNPVGLWAVCCTRLAAS
ncbi:uncharacterized protein ZC84.1-like [Pecten maximus]|uniref:uncharacterized protein ZC84.1-like n=1 Tax=Pecten maximus TaxID=6579 RepID=UPI001457E780|nr:uncharacterized protein ZC84.1-like [Pecten maximus]